MLRLTYASFLALGFALSACAEPGDSSQTLAPGGGKADGAETTLTFDEDFGEHADGPLVQGSTVRIAYDLDRVTDCRGRTNGSDVWGVTAYASFDGADPVSFPVSRIVDGTTTEVVAQLELPSDAESVALWFASSNRWGCLAYDSNEGANYTFDIEAAREGAVLSFDADYTQSLEGELQAGHTLTVHYAPSRLSQCEAVQGGYPQWSVTGYYQIDDGPVRMLAVTRADGPDLVAADPSIALPGTAERISLWFETVNRYGCHAYDSNFGDNYTYDVAAE